MKDKYPSDSADRFIVRMSPGTRDQVAALARKNKRSMNSEILAAIQGHLEPKTTAAADLIGPLAKSFAAEVGKVFKQALGDVAKAKRRTQAKPRR